MTSIARTTRRRAQQRRVGSETRYLLESTPNAAHPVASTAPLRNFVRHFDIPTEPVWSEENREAIEYYNAYVEKHGLPLDEFRQF